MITDLKDMLNLFIATSVLKMKKKTDVYMWAQKTTRQTQG